MMEEAYRITDEWKLYMYLLHCAIRKEEAREDVLRAYLHIDSKSLYNKAAKNGQQLLMASYIARFMQVQSGQDMKLDIPLKVIVRQYEHYKCIRSIVEKAREQELLLILFKGCMLADLYPEYIQRISCDTDILVNKEDRFRAEKLLIDLGYVINEDHSNPEVQVYQRLKPNHTVELHTCLWEDYTGRRLDILKSMNLSKRESLLSVEACGIQITTLGYEEHLIYQMFHIIKHFSLQGIGIKYLTDISLYVDAYGQYIDFADFWKKMEKLGYEKFCYEFFSLCIEWLGMDSRIQQGRPAQHGLERKLLLEDMFQLGLMYEDKSAGWQILGMMTPYFTGEKGTGKSSLERRLQVIFPKVRDLPDEYQCVKKFPVLLPFAWVYRAIAYVVRYYRNRTIFYSVSEKLDVAEKRIALMDSLGLLEQKKE